MITEATAHPAKFPDAMQQATGIRPVLPLAMKDLYERQERCEILPNSLEKVQEAVRSIAKKNNTF